MTELIVTMTSAGACFGVPVMRVRDVLDTPTIYRVPLAPPEIVGSINLRGRIVTAIDLRIRLGEPPRAEGSRCTCVIVEHQAGATGEPCALIVDEIGEVVAMDPAHYEPNPITLSKDWAAVCRGLYRRDDSLLLVLDIDALLRVDEAIAA